MKYKLYELYLEYIISMFPYPIVISHIDIFYPIVYLFTVAKQS